VPENLENNPRQSALVDVLITESDQIPTGIRLEKEGWTTGHAGLLASNSADDQVMSNDMPRRNQVGENISY
jgi:hypothetical protein